MSKLAELNEARRREGKQPLAKLPKRKSPETIQEHKDEAILLISMAGHTPFGDEAKYMRAARRHVEAAELLQRLEDLHR